MRTRRAVAALVVGLAVSIAMRPDVAAAQSSPGNGAGPSGAAPLQEVVVTGTSIKGISAETALPVQVLKSEDVARTGATTAEELLAKMRGISVTRGLRLPPDELVELAPTRTPPLSAAKRSARRYW